MDQARFETAVAQLEAAITDERGELRPIDRIEFEPLGGQIRWSIWQDGRRLHALTARPSDLPGLLTASKLFLEIRTAQGECQHGATV